MPLLCEDSDRTHRCHLWVRPAVCASQASLTTMGSQPGDALSHSSLSRRVFGSKPEPFMQAPASPLSLQLLRVVKAEQSETKQ